jgi:hypothetical protein
MIIRKTLVAGLALAIAVAFSPLSELQAAALVGPGAQPAAENLTHVVAAKKQKGKSHATKKHHRMHSKGGASKAGRCGVNMYYKKGKCMDARKK